VGDVLGPVAFGDPVLVLGEAVGTVVVAYVVIEVVGCETVVIGDVVVGEVVVVKGGVVVGVPEFAEAATYARLIVLLCVFSSSEFSSALFV